MENHPLVENVANRQITREEVMYQKKPQHLGQALSQLISSRGIARSMQNKQLDDVWKDVAGTRIATATKVGSLKNGSLSIYVGNSALLGELVSFHQRSLLEGLQKKYPQQKINQLKFRLKNSAGT